MAEETSALTHEVKNFLALFSEDTQEPSPLLYLRLASPYVDDMFWPRFEKHLALPF